MAESQRLLWGIARAHRFAAWGLRQGIPMDGGVLHAIVPLLRIVQPLHAELFIDWDQGDALKYLSTLNVFLPAFPLRVLDRPK